MCRYAYGDGRCANSDIEEAYCIGQQECDLFAGTGEQDEEACDFDSWYGVYCAKYKRFFCPGKDGCQSYEDYARNLEEHRRKSVRSQGP